MPDSDWLRTSLLADVKFSVSSEWKGDAASLLAHLGAAGPAILGTVLRVEKRDKLRHESAAEQAACAQKMRAAIVNGEEATYHGTVAAIQRLRNYMEEHSASFADALAEEQLSGSDSSDEESDDEEEAAGDAVMQDAGDAPNPFCQGDLVVLSESALADRAAGLSQRATHRTSWAWDWMTATLAWSGPEPWMSLGRSRWRWAAAWR